MFYIQFVNFPIKHICNKFINYFLNNKFLLKHLDPYFSIPLQLLIFYNIF